MLSVVKTLLLGVIKLQFRAGVDDDFVDLISLGKNRGVVGFPRASKTGTYSFRIVGRKLNYKLYGCMNQIWADNVYQATKSLQQQEISVPQIIQKKGKYILAAWIEGQDLRNSLGPTWNNRYQTIVQYQADIHNAQVLDSHYPSLSYLNDFLIPRFVKYARHFLTPDQITLILRYIAQKIEEIGPRSVRVSNPDFTHFNIVQNGDKFIIIDNETLHYDALWEYDVLNTANILFAPLGLKETYLEVYSQYVDISSLYRYADFWEVIWLIRMAGGKLQVRSKKEGKLYLMRLTQKVNG